MLQILTKTRLAQNIFLKLLKPMKPGIRDERAAWILRSGELGPVKTGTTQKVEQADKPVGGEIVGYVHIHPTLPTYLNPPSAGSMDSDYDKTLIEYPLQFVVESSKGRVWAQFPPRHACLLGRINVVTGAFQPLDAKELMAATVYKVISVDGWRLMEAMKPKDARGK